jgi:DNA helicase II / ATP-dependent DNA helicase PcrA
MFIWKKNELNSEQELAILEKESVLLVACPGSGKTRVLTYKIAYELEKLSSNKEFIIAITYTNNAADEIKERIELLGINTSQLWIGTIHSFCLEWILRPYYLYLDELKNGFRVINAHESEEILTSLCKPFSSQKITYWDCGILAKSDKYYLTCLDVKKHENLKKIYKQYFELLKENNQIDFEQILFYSFQILSKKQIVSSILSNLFPFILIDEYQDTKEIQYQIIAKILNTGSKNSKTLIVGDPNQSIFESLGGFPMKKNEMESLFGFELKEMGLSKNYRSSEKIVNYFDYYKTYNNTIISVGTDRDYESNISFNKSIPREELIDEVVKLIKINIEEYRISPNEICIVAPYWYHLASLTRSLMVKLPELSFDGPGMAPFSRDIDNFWYKLSRIILTEPSPFLYVRRMRWSKELLNELENAGVNLSNMTSKKFLKLCNSIQLAEENGLKYLEIFFVEICKILAIEISIYPTLLEHQISFFESSKSRIVRLKKEGNEFIDNIVNFRKVFKQRHGITISTIHGIKGEEYDTMIGFALLNSYIPHFSDSNGENNSKKMLYVLSSRARKNLHLISETGRGKNYHNPIGLSPTKHLLDYSYDYDNL